jgi:uncharacterized membrane protein HdeD (DUF308 family)
MENQISKYWYMVLLKGIIMVFMAILILARPADALLGIAVWIGIGMLITGLVVIVQGASLRKEDSGWGWKILEGCLDILFGFILMANPLVTSAVLPFLVGFWAAFYGVSLVIDSIAEPGNRFVKVVSGILIILMANAIMFNPLLAGMTMAVWFGIILLTIGVFNIIHAFSLK